MTSLRFPISSTAASSSEKRSSSPSPPPTIHNPHSPTSYLTYPVSHVVTGLYRRLTAPSPSSPLPPQSQNMTSLYQAPIRTHSPFNPPPLTPLTLRGILPSTSPRAQILSRALAEEIRLLVPPRLQLLSDWFLAYSIEQDGVSLSTLYSKCAEYGGRQQGFVLVVRDALGGVRFSPFPIS